MPLPGEQQKAAERVFEALYTHKVKGRVLSEMFQELPDKVTWADYYKVIPEPRSLHGIKVRGLLASFVPKPQLLGPTGKIR